MTPSQTLQQAEQLFKAGKLAQTEDDTHYLLGLAFGDDGKLDKALQHYRMALQYNPAHDRAANNMGTVLEKIGDEKAAMEFYERAVKANPKNAEAQNNLGAILSASGDLNRARYCFTASIEADPCFIHAHYNLSTLKKYTPDDSHLAVLEKLALRAQSLPADVLMRLWFSLGKAWEDVKRYDDSFAAYERGNRLYRATIAYDGKTVAKSTQDIIRRFDKTFFEKKITGCADKTPIFIIGMPRSGTTLLEQILSSHSAVFGAGELHDLCNTVSEQWKIAPGVSYVDALQSASEEELVAIVQSYIQKIRTLNPAAPRITDKMPGNYFYAGLIHKIFPHAKIIHSLRDPMDTCFSNYTRLFNQTMPFAYDLQELGRYHRQYEELMQHWKRVLPENAILDVRYEDVVADLEGQARRLLDHCGLPWEDQCLAFHENDRSVKTASIAQVRQPIYKSSIARWKHYRKHLEPLRLALEGKAQNLSIEQALALANQAQEKNQLAEAETLLRKILAAKPQEAQALHLLGIVAHKAGKPDLAIDLIKQAIRSDGKTALFHANLGEICRLHGQLAQAITHGKRATTLNPQLVSAQANLGIAYFDQKEYKKAEACQKAALNIDPHFPASLNNMGSILRAYKDDAGAMEYYHRAIQANPRDTAPLNNLGEVLLRNDRPQEALTYLDKAVAMNPRYAQAHGNRAYALSALSQKEEAHQAFLRALQLQPDYAEAYAGLARLFTDLLRLSEAESFALKAIELKPDMAEFQSILASIYLAQTHTDKALETFEAALKTDPELAGAQLGIGSIMLERGELEKAETIFRDVIYSGQERINALFSLSQAIKTRPGDPLISLLEKEAEKLEALPDEKSSRLHFALGKTYDDQNNTEKAFPHFLAGCRLHRKHIKYNAAEKYKLFAHQKELFSKSFIDQNRRHGFSDATPIFVLGMPRSGTTLTEQIVASHPHVFGAGELPDLAEILQHKSFSLTPQEMEALGQQYVTGLRARAPGAQHITDKMPDNYFHIGMIHLALPQAKIVHVERHPLDTCLSCFTRLFSHPQEHTYDLYELGRFYREYSHLMDHWRAVLPEGSFYTIRYEELVEDTETQARRLIDYCGLEWNDACLEPHKIKRAVRTASVTQVRQPVYKSSVARWKKYERFLGPLIEGLGDALEGKPFSKNPLEK